MANLNKKVLFFAVILCAGGCGVKGRPNPPKNPPALGRGEPTYKETKKKNVPGSGASHSADESGQ